MAQTSAPVKLPHLAASDDILKECSAIEIGLEELKAAYEQYFLGMERLPPARAHQRLRSRFNQVRSTFNRTTSVRFRVQGLSSKFLIYERLWQRTMEAIETGTYKRDLFKARLHSQRRESSPPADEEGPPAAAAPTGPSTDSPPDALAGELSEARLRAVYRDYLEAKKRCGEDVSKTSFQSVASQLRKQVRGILEKHQASSVELKVAIKDGRVVLRAAPAAAPGRGR